MEDLTPCYRDPDIWVDFDPDLMTLASPDPQAFRPPEEASGPIKAPPVLVEQDTPPTQTPEAEPASEADPTDVVEPTAIRPFQVNVPDEDLVELRGASTRPDGPNGRRCRIRRRLCSSR